MCQPFLLLLFLCYHRSVPHALQNARTTTPHMINLGNTAPNAVAYQPMSRPQTYRAKVETPAHKLGTLFSQIRPVSVDSTPLSCVSLVLARHQPVGVFPLLVLFFGFCCDIWTNFLGRWYNSTSLRFLCTLVRQHSTPANRTELTLHHSKWIRLPSGLFFFVV